MGERGAVVLVHGLFLSPKWMWPLARDLKRAGFGPVWNLGYGRGPDLTTICARLGDELERKRAAHDGGRGWQGPVHGLGLSMGGLILRRLHADGFLPPHESAHYVTLGTPHAGAARAAWGTKAMPRLSRFVYGPTLIELVPGSPFLAGLPQLPLERLTCVYSGRGHERGRSRVVPGDDDGVVETSSARVDGAFEAYVPDVHHYWISLRRRTRRAAVDALLRGTARASQPQHG